MYIILSTLYYYPDQEGNKILLSDNDIYKDNEDYNSIHNDGDNTSVISKLTLDNNSVQDNPNPSFPYNNHRKQYPHTANSGASNNSSIHTNKKKKNTVRGNHRTYNHHPYDNNELYDPTTTVTTGGISMMRLNSISLPRGISAASATNAMARDAQVTDLEKALELKQALQEWNMYNDNDSINSNRFSHYSSRSGSPLIATNIIDPAENQPFRKKQYSSIPTGYGLLTNRFENDGSVSVHSTVHDGISRHNSTSSQRSNTTTNSSSSNNNPIFKTTQLRQMPYVPYSTTTGGCGDSISAASNSIRSNAVSRVGSKRSPNKKLLREELR